MTKTVDFNTAVCTYDEMAKLNDTQLALSFSIYSVMEERLWRFAQKHDAFRDPNVEVISKRIQGALDTIRAAYIASYPERCFVWFLQGTTRSDELTYKGIEKAITKEFGTEGISLLSESDYFHVEVCDAKMEPLRKFLKELDPDLAYCQEPCDKDEIGKPVEGGWDYTAAIVKKAKIKVVIKMPSLTPKSKDEIAAKMRTARLALEKTGLTPMLAVHMLAEEMGVQIDRADYIKNL